MKRKELLEDMKILAELEFRNQGDNFDSIEVLVDEYIREYGADKKLCEFRSAYLDIRHQGFYEQAKWKRK